MLERLTNLPQGVDGLKATGTITKADYERTFEPLVDAARQEGRRLRFLYHLGPEFNGVTPGAAWEDVRVGRHSLRLFEGCAIVSDSAWVNGLAQVAGIMMPCPVRVFGNEAYSEAAEWLAALPERDAHIAHHLIPQLEVMVVEVKGPLRTRDFEELTLTADAWIEARGELHGLIVRAREFPGWENFQSFLRHIRFREEPPSRSTPHRAGDRHQAGELGAVRRRALREGGAQELWLRRPRSGHSLGGRARLRPVRRRSRDAALPAHLNSFSESRQARRYWAGDRSRCAGSWPCGRRYRWRRPGRTHRSPPQTATTGSSHCPP